MIVLGRRDRRGQALVEFALIAPAFVLLLVGLFDAGRAVYAYSTVNNAAHTAARQAVVDQNVGDVKTAAIEQAPGLQLAIADVTVTWLDANGGATLPCSNTPNVGCTAEVRVRYSFTAATPLLGNLMGSIQLEGVARQPIERRYTSP